MSMPPVLPRWQRALVVATPPIVVLAFALVLYRAIEWHQETAARVDRTHVVLSQMAELEARMVDAETGQRGYIITGDSSYLGPYEGASADAEVLLADLRLALGDDPEQRATLEQLAAVVHERLEILDARVVIRADSGFPAARTAVITGGGRDAMNRVRALVDELEERENEQLSAYQTTEARADTLVLVALLTGVIVVIGAALFTSRVLVGQERSVREMNKELTVANVQLQEQAIELETQAEELQTQSMHLEELTVELEASNEELQTTATQAEHNARESERANRAKTDFLATMSHELRTPLNAITGYVDLLELEVHGEVNELQRSSLERVRFNAKHLLVLINDILNFAKLEAGSIELRPSRLALDAVLNETVELVGPLLDAKGIHFDYAVLPSETMVVGDRDRIRQVLFNLITNAIKFTGAGGTVSLSADSDNGSVHIRVRDTGPGIPQDMQERIFDPFVQLRRGAGGGLSDGVGLGLAISRELARAMHGDLVVESEPEQGATFTLTLRRAEMNAAVAAGN
jgi:signal transduction histidine kinase